MVKVFTFFDFKQDYGFFWRIDIITTMLYDDLEGW